MCRNKHCREIKIYKNVINNNNNNQNNIDPRQHQQDLKQMEASNDSKMTVTTKFKFKILFRSSICNNSLIISIC